MMSKKIAIMKTFTFLLTFSIGSIVGSISFGNTTDCGSNRKYTLFGENEAKALKNRQVITFDGEFACSQEDLTGNCIDIKSDSIGEIIGYKPVYKIDLKTELETKDIEGYKLIVKWKNIDSNYTSYYFKKSYFVGDKEYSLNQILEK